MKCPECKCTLLALTIRKSNGGQTRVFCPECEEELGIDFIRKESRKNTNIAVFSLVTLIIINIAIVIFDK